MKIAVSKNSELKRKEEAVMNSYSREMPDFNLDADMLDRLAKVKSTLVIPQHEAERGHAPITGCAGCYSTCSGPCGGTCAGSCASSCGNCL
jgi:hypothetical protein